MAPRPHPVPTEASSGSGRSGPYSPLKDPTIVVLLLIVAVTVVLMVTGAGASLVGGGGSGPVFPIDFSDDNRTVTLSIDANRSSTQVGDAVAYEVTRGATDDPVANATVSVAGESYRTGADGRVVVTVESAGEYDVVATKSPTNTTEFRSARTRLTVERRVVALSVTANATDVQAGDTVRFRVRRGDGAGPVDGTVAVAGREVQVRNGTATVTFDAAGEYEAVARVPETGTTRFEPATTAVTVERRVASLRVRIVAADPVAPTNVTVRVSRADTGGAVNATLTVGTRSLPTGDDGRATVRFDAAGEYTVRADLPQTPAVRFRTGRATVTVDRQRVPLAVRVSPGERVDPDEPVRLTLVRTDTGDPVTGEVRVGDTTYETGPDGEVVVRRTDPAVYAVVGTKANTTTETFVAAETAVTVVAPEFRVTEATLPASATAGETVTVTVTVRNVGTGDGSTTVRYLVAGLPAGSQAVSLAAGDATTVTVDAVVPEIAAGEYLQWVVVGTDGRADVLVVRARGERVATLTGRPPTQ